jgi:exodeoxyribonuclease V gamma subunit
VTLDLAVGEFSISGDLHQVLPTGLLFYRPATIKPKDLLRAWIQHLLWCASDRKGKPAETLVLGTESVFKMTAAAEPLAVLHRLLHVYWTGLSIPSKFFPETSYAFAEADFKLRNGRAGRTVKTPILFAQERWHGVEYGPPGECEDSYVSLFFRNGDPLDTEFENSARTVFDPLFGVLEEVSG